jgi:glycine dehydrogenase subunit 2
VTGFRQARWPEPPIFEAGRVKSRGHRTPNCDEASKRDAEALQFIPANLLRRAAPTLPDLSEVEVVRHFTRLSQANFGVDTGIYPLGSCTMKYSPKVNDAIANLDTVHWIHPYQEEATVQGALEIMYTLAQWLADLTGMHGFTLQPAAGAHGEYVGALIMRAYHRERGDLETRREIIVPDSAHGTNLASAAMAGFRVVVVPSNPRGCVDMGALAGVVSGRTAGLMLTNPNTLGIFEENILEIAGMIHEVGGLLYYDGANLNAIMGKARPGDMGFDIVHLNLHKTFSTPHGGGGPGAGPVGVVGSLTGFLPVPTVGRKGDRFYWNYNHPQTIGRVSGFYGNFEVLVKAYAYIRAMGGDGLRRAAELSVLNANYLAHKIAAIEGFSLPYGRGIPRKHECVISCARLWLDTGVTAKDVAKRLLDFGVHAPTMYFPPIVEEALMLEPTETESLEDLDRYVEIFAQVAREAYTDPTVVVEAPHFTAVRGLDEVKASHPRTLCLSWRMHRNQQGRAP